MMNINMKNLPVCRLFLSHLVRLWDLQFPEAQSKDMNNENINKTAIFLTFKVMQIRCSML